MVRQHHGRHLWADIAVRLRDLLGGFDHHQRSGQYTASCCPDRRCGRAEPYSGAQLYLLNSLARQVVRVPTLREALWNVEAAVLERLWRAAATQDPDTASALGCRVGRLLGPLSHQHKHILANLRTAFSEGWPASGRRGLAADAPASLRSRSVVPTPCRLEFHGEAERSGIIRAYEVVTDAGSQGKLVSERSRPVSARSAYQAAQAASTTAA